MSKSLWGVVVGEPNMDVFRRHHMLPDLKHIGRWLTTWDGRKEVPRLYSGCIGAVKEAKQSREDSPFWNYHAKKYEANEGKTNE